MAIETPQPIQEYWDFVIKPTLKIPYIDISEWHNSGNFGYMVPSLLFKYYKESNYYYNGDNRFIHYTFSLDTALKIINSGFIKANDATLLDDSQELFFAGNHLLSNYSKDELNDLKRRVFSFSMCKNEDFDMWRWYGNKGKGVGLVFNFFIHWEHWKGSFLNDIFYDDKEKLNAFNELAKRHKEFHEKYMGKYKITENALGKEDKIPSWVSIFLAFHKSSLYKNENEVRFLKFDDNDLLKDTQKTGISHSHDFASARYFMLPILTRNSLLKIINEGIAIGIKNNTNVQNENDFNIANHKESISKLNERRYNLEKHNLFFENDEIGKKLINEIIAFNEPVIWIEKIVLGYKYTDDEYNKIKQSLKPAIAKGTGFDILIERSELRESYIS